MYQAPEVWHLQEAIKAIKNNLMPQKKTEPEPEENVSQTDHESEESTEKE